MYSEFYDHRTRRTIKARMAALILFRHFQGFFIFSEFKFALSETRHFTKTSVVMLHKRTICSGNGFGTLIIAPMWKCFALWESTLLRPRTYNLKMIWNFCEIPQLQKTFVETAPMSMYWNCKVTKSTWTQGETCHTPKLPVLFGCLKYGFGSIADTGGGKPGCSWRWPWSLSESDGYARQMPRCSHECHQVFLLLKSICFSSAEVATERVCLHLFVGVNECVNQLTD